MKKFLIVLTIIGMLSGCSTLGIENPLTPDNNCLKENTARYRQLEAQWKADFSYGDPRYGQMKYELCRYLTAQNKAMQEHCGDIVTQKALITKAMNDLEAAVAKIYMGKGGN